MTPTIPWFRDLYDSILEYEGEALFADVLAPWVEQGRPAMQDLRRFQSLAPYDRTDGAAQFAMWNLYALSRVNDMLLPAFRPDETPTWSRAPVTQAEYVEFSVGMGLTIARTAGFTPFHHEIVRVHPTADDAEPIQVVDVVWPGLMWGNMLFSRSGVVVRGGRQHVVQVVAERSTLYFTFLRRHRPTSDLSHGWGHNSQWRTDFRRDYQTDEKWLYNVDGSKSLNALRSVELDPDGLTPAERIELCRNRCFVTTSKPDRDLSPFQDRFAEAAGF